MKTEIVRTSVLDKKMRDLPVTLTTADVLARGRELAETLEGRSSSS